MDRACRDVGFLQVVGHGFPQSVLDATLAAMDEFFALPLAVKAAWASPSPDVNRGYAAERTEGLSYSLGLEQPPDLFEAFNIGPDDIDRADPVIAADPHNFFVANIWPDEPAGFRPALVAHFEAATALARRLTGIFATALALEPDFFVDKVDHSTTTMRTINYERRAGSPPPLPDQMRMGAHTDYGICTVLHADPVPGLQIVGPDGAWHDVVPQPGALLINLGDLLAEWTNDRWRSTLHRVVPPPSEADGSARRRSVAFFFDGNYDAVVECLPSCCSADNPPRYPPVRAGDHLLAKLLGPRTLSASTATSTASGRLTAG